MPKNKSTLIVDCAIIPFDEWERTEKAKDILEHVYLAEIIKERKDSEPTINLDDLLNAEGLTISSRLLRSTREKTWKSIV